MDTTSTTTNTASSSSVDLMEEAILAAVNHLLDLKMRVSHERICRHVSRHHFIGESHVSKCIEKLCEQNRLLYIDYKGKRSYRNPQHVHTNHRRSKILNSPPISKALQEIFQQMQQAASTSSADPHRPIHIRDIQQTVQSECASVPAGSMCRYSVLTNCSESDLELYVDRECDNGHIVKLSQGYYKWSLALPSSQPESLQPSPVDPAMECKTEPLAHGGDNLLDRSVCNWSVDDVHFWLCHEGFHHEADALFREEIDGQSILLLTKDDVIKQFGLKFGPALKLFHCIQEMKHRYQRGDSFP